MVRLPRQPAALDLPADVVALPAGSLLWRIYRRGGPHGTAWNQFRTDGPVATARFDHHPAPPRSTRQNAAAVLYAGVLGPACLAEAFQATRAIMRRFRDPHLAAFTLNRDVHVLDLCGLWPTAAGASQALASGPRASSRAWARAVRAAYPDVEGLSYRSSMCGGEPVVVLNELAANATPTTPDDDIPLGDPTLTAYLDDVATSLRFRVID